MISQVLCEDSPDNDPAPYIPTFYQFSEFIEHTAATDVSVDAPACLLYPMVCDFYCLQEQLMQQPLSHLYFFTILENVSNLDFGLSGLITTSQKISKVLYLLFGFVHWCL